MLLSRVLGPRAGSQRTTMAYSADAARAVSISQEQQATLTGGVGGIVAARRALADGAAVAAQDLVTQAQAEF
eukprot:4934453-Alexandrium_andersonii.AAC.1